MDKIENIDTLGSYLKSVRIIRSLSLRELEVSTGISNAYISQLENNKIKTPSSNILYKLSNALMCDFNVLMKLSGIIEGIPNTNRIKAVYFESSLTEEEEKILRDFLKYIRHKKQNA